MRVYEQMGLDELLALVTLLDAQRHLSPPLVNVREGLKAELSARRNGGTND